MLDLVHKYVKAGSAVKLAAQFEGLVRSGRIPPEALLPSVRDVAKVLGVSPGTAAAAYKALRAQGLVSADGRRGTRVLPHPAQREYIEAEAPAGTVDLQVANPDPQFLPQMREVFASLDLQDGGYGGEHLDPLLHRWAQGALGADGISARHVIVTSGAIPAIHRALRACLKPGDKVAVEDPGFNEHHASVRAHGMLPTPVAMDDQGMLPGSLAAALRQGASGVILSPRFQSPLGAAVTPGRALELRAVLRSFPEVMVIADDYASLITEWAYPDCVGADRVRWLVVRSFNKALGPDLRVGFAAGDGETVDRLRREQWLSDGWVSGYLQRAAAQALSSRSVLARLARARKTYAARRDALLAALRQRGIAAHGVSGLNVWVPVEDEAAVVRGMLARGWCIRSGARYRIHAGAAVRITAAQLEPERAEEVADALSGVLRPTLGRTP